MGGPEMQAGGGSGRAPKGCDSVAVRVRWPECLVGSVAPPFRLMHWPDVRPVAADLGLEAVDLSGGNGSPDQERFLSALVMALEAGEAFRPRSVRFPCSPRELLARERFRVRHAAVVALGCCPREVMLGALEAVTRHLDGDGAVDVTMKGWEAEADWAAGQEATRDVLRYLATTGRRPGSVTIYSSLREVDRGLCGLLYEWPRARLGWVASELAECADLAAFARHRQQSAALRNLERLSGAGAWPHIVLPATGGNSAVLPDLVAELIDLTRGGTVELKPSVLLPREGGASRPSVEDYVAAVVSIYRGSRVPLRLFAPVSWVAVRLDAEVPLLSSRAAAGAEIAVLPHGDLYAGEAAVGLREWRLGNVLDDPENLRWERLDAMAEVFSHHSKPEACQKCDWRYRCGGVDPAVQLLEEARKRRATGGELANSEGTGAGSAPGPMPAQGTAGGSTDAEQANELFDWYCAPRRALFEEMIWDCIDAARQASTPRGRELLELHQASVNFRPAGQPKEDSCS